MLGLLRRLADKAPQPKATPRFARLRLEPLEARQVPATLTLSVSYGTGKTVTLSGTLSGLDNPSLQMITLGGQVSDTTYTNSLGQFSVTETAVNLGDVTATFVPTSMSGPSTMLMSATLSSYSGTTMTSGSGATAGVTLTDVAPSLTFYAEEHPGRLWTLYGDVTYSRGPANLVVYFGGVPVSLEGKTATTGNTGHYETSLFLNGTSSDNGTAEAVVRTPWNTASEVAIDNIHQSGT